MEWQSERMTVPTIHHQFQYPMNQIRQMTLAPSDWVVYSSRSVLGSITQVYNTRAQEDQKLSRRNQMRYE